MNLCTCNVDSSQLSIAKYLLSWDCIYLTATALCLKPTLFILVIHTLLCPCVGVTYVSFWGCLTHSSVTLTRVQVIFLSRSRDGRANWRRCAETVWQFALAHATCLVSGNSDPKHSLTTLSKGQKCNFTPDSSTREGKWHNMTVCEWKPCKCSVCCKWIFAV